MIKWSQIDANFGNGVPTQTGMATYHKMVALKANTLFPMSAKKKEKVSDGSTKNARFGELFIM